MVSVREVPIAENKLYDLPCLDARYVLRQLGFFDDAKTEWLIPPLSSD
jgi:hypothetical protein